MTCLNKMSPGQTGKVASYTSDTPMTRRLTELGLVPGREIIYLRNAPLNDPLEIQIGSSCLALRHAEASLVAVELDQSK